MDWRPFDIKSFLKASRYWKQEKKRLERELDNLLYLPSVNNESGVRSGEIANPTAKTALRKLEIQERLQEINLNEEMLAYAFGQLSKDEKNLIDGFFYPTKTIGSFVYDYGHKYGLCKDYVYAERERVLDKMRRSIEAEFYGEE